MQFREQVPLRTLTTFKIGGPAAAVAECETIDELKAAFLHAQERGLSAYPLGEGSNLLSADAGTQKMLVISRDASCVFEPVGEKQRVITGAGMHWDTLVEACALRELWGMENLAGIPGTVGAAPVQNIGAYGAEVADVIEWVEAIDMRSGEVRTFSAEECAFAYRESRFKKEPHWFITRVSFVVSLSPCPRIDYPDLRALAASGRILETPLQIAQAVREIRSRKFPDLNSWGTAGSFFKNPIITPDAYAALQGKYPGIPGFPDERGVKVPLAWILDKILSLRGFAIGPVHLFENQPLVVIAAIGARASDVDALAQAVTEKVFAATGIEIEREVRTLD